jgi:DNA invertase Pin-like site-specific DNA recombinase
MDKKHLIFGQYNPIMLGIERRRTSMKRAAIYLRVSTKNHGQTVDTQRVAIVEFAKNRGFEIVAEYADEGISGSKDSRPALDLLMKHAQAKKFDAVIVARFDRFARSTKHLVLALEQFSHLGIDFISLSESVDTSTPMGRMIFTVLGAVAELERNLIRERVAMGLDRARKQKKTLGRPRSIFDRDKAKELHAQGMSLRQIADQLGVNKGTVRAAISAA